MADEPVSKQKPIEAAEKPSPAGLLSRLKANPATAVGALLLIAAAGAGVVFMMGQGSSGGTAGKSLIADMPTEPDTDWKYTFASSDDEYLMGSPIAVSVTDETALVWASFDWDSFYYSQGGSYGWYEGYADDYSAGYDAGLAYEVAYEEWWNSDWDSDIPYPDMEDYYPAGTIDYPPDGWWAGFNDGEYGDPRGTSELVEPETPDFSADVTLLDLRTGDSIWDLDVVGLVDDFDNEMGLSATPITGTDFIVFVAPSVKDDSRISTLISVSASSGEVVSDTEIDGYADVVTVNGGLFVLADSPDEQWVARLNPSDLDGEPIWESDADNATYLMTIGEFVVATDYDSSYVFEPESGDEPKWGDDIDYYTSYQFVQGQLVRYEMDQDTYDVEIVGQDEMGKDTWKDSVSAEWTYYDYSGNGDVLLVADETSDGIERLQRLNPKTGEEMWKDSYRDELAWVEGVFSGVILASEVGGDRFVAISLDSGEELYSRRISDYVTGFWPGINFVYSSNDQGELIAYSIADGEEAWTYDFNEDKEWIMSIGKHLFLVNSDKHTISLLK